jgi:hypothetical protein
MIKKMVLYMEFRCTEKVLPLLYVTWAPKHGSLATF